MLLAIETKIKNEIGTLALTGILDISTVNVLGKSLVAFEGIKNLHLDLARLRFIDSTGIQGLVQLIRECRESGIGVKILNISKGIFDVLDIIGFIDIFGDEIFDFGEYTSTSLPSL